jgi:FADH2 O2-dependent halogenase
MLPSAAGFVDPLFSTGFALGLRGVERLALVARGGFASDDLCRYAEETEGDLLAAARMIGAMYATMGNFEAFAAVSLVYFAAVSFAETAHRLGKPELAPGFLMHRHPGFGQDSRKLLARAHDLVGVAETRAFVDDVRRLIAPFNVGGFGEPARRNWYPVFAEDLLDAGYKLGARREEMVALLERAGFYGSSSVACEG